MLTTRALFLPNLSPMNPKRVPPTRVKKKGLIMKRVTQSQPNTRERNERETYPPDQTDHLGFLTRLILIRRKKILLEERIKVQRDSKRILGMQVFG